MKVIFVGSGLANIESLLTLRNYFKHNNIEVLLVSEYEIKVYSGMIPGVLAKIYKEKENIIDLNDLCNKLNIKFIKAKVNSIDKQEKRIYLKSSVPNNEILDYDILSLCVGALTKQLDIESVKNSNIIYSHPTESKVHLNKA